MILGKPAYYENVAAFPFTDLKEIRSAVAMDQTSYAPFATDMFFIRRISRSQEGARVNLWFVRPAYIEQIRRYPAWLILPETAVWSAGTDSRGRIYKVSRGGDQLMIHVDKDGIVRSSLAENREADLEGFQRSLGPDVKDCSVEHLESSEQYFNGFFSRLEDASVADLIPFLAWRTRVKKINPVFIKRAAASLLILAAGYGLLWAGLPCWMARQLEKENQQLSENLGEVIARQSEIEAMQTRINTLSGPIEAYLPKVPLFNQLYETIPDQATIRRLNIAGGRVEIEGRSEQASVVLTDLSNETFFENVQLTQPLKKDSRSGQEVFSVSFQVKPEALLQTAAKNGS